MRASLSTRRKRGGFTLLELLVAAGITALMAGFIAIVIRNIGASWSRTSGRLGTEAQARLVLDQLALDLQGALFREDGNTWMAVDVLNGANGNASGLWQTALRNPKPTGGLSLQMTAADISEARFGTAGVWLRFFTTSRPSAGATAPNNVPAPVAVGYQIIRRFTAVNPANTTSIGYLLHRAEARPAGSGSGTAVRPGVLESGYNITAAAYTTSRATTNNGATTGDPASIQVPGTNTGASRNLDSVIAENVIDFGVRCYVRDAAAPGGLRLVFPANNETGALSNATTARLRAQFPGNTPATSSNYNFVFPDVVDIMVRVLTDEGATAIANLERVQTPALIAPTKYSGNAQQWWWGVAQENSRVYTRRVVINGGPL